LAKMTVEDSRDDSIPKIIPWRDSDYITSCGDGKAREGLNEGDRAEITCRQKRTDSQTGRKPGTH